MPSASDRPVTSAAAWSASHAATGGFKGIFTPRGVACALGSSVGGWLPASAAGSLLVGTTWEGRAGVVELAAWGFMVVAGLWVGNRLGAPGNATP